MGILSPIDSLKKATSGFRFKNDFLDSLLGAKVRNIGEAAEDRFYGMFGSLGMKVLDAKERAEQQNAAAAQAVEIFPNKKLRKKLKALVIKKLNIKASVIGKKNTDAQERINEVKDLFAQAQTIEEFAAGIKAAVRIETSVIGVISRVYEEFLAVTGDDDTDFESIVGSMNLDNPQAAASVQQLLIQTKQTEFAEAVREDPTSLSKSYVKEHQAEIEKISKLDGDALRDYLLNVGKNESPQIKEQVTEIAITGALSRPVTAARSSRPQARPQVAREESAPVAAPEAGRQQSREQLTQSAGSNRPNLQAFLGGTGGTSEGMLGGIGDEIASGLGTASATLTSGELIMAMDRLEGALTELGSMLSSGEIKPEQLTEAFGGMMSSEELGTTGVETEIEQQAWEEGMLENTIAIKEALEGKETTQEPKEGKGIFGSLFGKLGDMFKFIKPFLSSLGSVLMTAVRVVGPMLASAASALLPIAAVLAAGFAGYKLGQWLDEKLSLSEGIADAVDKVMGWLGNSTEDKIKESSTKLYQESLTKGDGKIAPKVAAMLAKDGVEIDPATIRTEEEQAAVISANQAKAAGTTPASELKTQNIVATTNAELDANNQKSIGNVTSIGPTTTINNKTIAPRPSNFAQVRPVENALNRQKDRNFTY